METDLRLMATAPSRPLRSPAIAFVPLLVMLLCAYARAQSCPTVITSCGCSIDAPGNYIIGAPLTGRSGTDCIMIKAHHVTLDLNSNPITGPGAPDNFSGSGIHVAPHAHHVTIDGDGATISGFGFGLEIEASHATARDFSADDNGEGVALYAHHAYIADVEAGNNTDCGVLVRGSENKVGRVEANNNSNVGIAITPSAVCSCGLRSNVCICFGIPPVGSDQLPAIPNSTEKGDRRERGMPALRSLPLPPREPTNPYSRETIVFVGGSENKVEQVEANNNGTDGIALSGPSRNRLANFTADSNGSNGVSESQTFCDSDVCTATPAKRNSIKKGEASNNRTYGIGLYQGSRHTRVEGNTANANGADDLFDFNPDCDHDRWKDNTFATSNQECIH